jgi:hypothetical protein
MNPFLMPGTSQYNNPYLNPRYNLLAGDPRLTHLGAPVGGPEGNMSPVNQGFNQLAIDTSEEASRLRQVQENQNMRQLMLEGLWKMQASIAEGLAKGMGKMGDAFTKIT